MARVRNVDQLRHAIDTGVTGDKVGFSDPAVAPLGTDAEAGGHSPTLAEVSLDVKAAGAAPRRRMGDAGFIIYLAVSGGLALAALLAVALAR